MKELIEFAIQNGFVIPFLKEFSVNSKTIDIVDLDGYQKEYNLIETITSSEFIDALARGLMKEGIHISTDLIIWGGNYESCCNLSETDTLRYKLSDAIAEKTLPEFITNLGIGKK